MQDLTAERAFYDRLFAEKPENEHITEGYEELYDIAFATPPEGRVLDLGCGTGAHAIRLARRGFDVVAVDLTVGGVQSARKRFDREGLEGAFLVADAENLPLRDGAFSVAWTSLLLHHFTRLDKLPKELARVARDRVIAFEPNASNLLTWVAFNIINRFWGISGMTRNQKALRPKPLWRIFRQHGFGNWSATYVDRGWSDKMAGVRRWYAIATSWLPLRYRANKFLVSFHKNA